MLRRMAFNVFGETAFNGIYQHVTGMVPCAFQKYLRARPPRVPIIKRPETEVANR
jgi:hypothetical protein